MSVTLYFLRHGETVYSETGAYCGEVDAELTPDGVRMAKAVAEVYRLVTWTAAYCESSIPGDHGDSAKVSDGECLGGVSQGNDPNCSL